MAQITAGVGLFYGVTTSASTTPSSWTKIHGITEIPEIGGQPDTYETTSLDNLQFKTYVDGLKDIGGALGFTANDTPEFRTEVAALLAAQNESGKYIHFAINVPSPISKHMVFTGKASDLGFGGAAINEVLTTTLYITPSGEPVWVDGVIAEASI